MDLLDIVSIRSSNSSSHDGEEPIHCMNTECIYPYGPACLSCATAQDQKEEAREERKEQRRQAKANPIQNLAQLEAPDISEQSAQSATYLESSVEMSQAPTALPELRRENAEQYDTHSNKALRAEQNFTSELKIFLTDEPQSHPAQGSQTLTQRTEHIKESFIPAPTPEPPHTNKLQTYSDKGTSNKISLRRKDNFTLRATTSHTNKFQDHSSPNASSYCIPPAETHSTQDSQNHPAIYTSAPKSNISDGFSDSPLKPLLPQEMQTPTQAEKKHSRMSSHPQDNILKTGHANLQYNMLHCPICLRPLGDPTSQHYAKCRFAHEEAEKLERFSENQRRRQWT